MLEYQDFTNGSGRIFSEAGTRPTAAKAAPDTTPKCRLLTGRSEIRGQVVTELPLLAGFVYVPCMEEDGNAWQRHWNAIVLGEHVEPHS